LTTGAHAARTGPEPEFAEPMPAQRAFARKRLGGN
jgi:hypothetical protein